MRNLFVLVALMIVGSLTTVQAQEKNPNGYPVGGTIVSIDGKNPIGQKFEHDGIEFEITRLTSDDVEVKIKNNTSDMVLLSFNDSYFVSGEETEPVITDETIMMDIDKPIQDAKIAPNTFISKRLMNKELLSLSMPLFSNKWSNNTFKKTGQSTYKKLVVSVKKGEDKVQHSFDFKIQGSNELKALRTKK